MNLNSSRKILQNTHKPTYTGRGTPELFDLTEEIEKCEEGSQNSDKPAGCCKSQ